MTDYMSLGSTPAGEDCAQVGSENYHERAQKEGRIYIAQLRRQFGEPPAGAAFKIKGFPHDFGTYYEVCVVYNDASEEATEFAYKCESELPECWDDIAQAHLLPKFGEAV